MKFSMRALTGILLSLGFTTANAKPSCCSSLETALGSKLSHPSSAAYSNSLLSYWTAFASTIKPSCVVSAESTEDVAIVVKTLTDGDCQFAIRSGGHSPWGSSNVEDGVVIDLSALKQVIVSEDRSTVHIGAGNRWKDVYSVLDKVELTVPGGRVGTVGVGGLLMGGGISFFSPRFGFSCDSVINYEVVLSSGEIIQANASSHPDLWKALKGSGNNLGVVTRFDMKAVEVGKFWGGMAFHLISGLEQMVTALADFASNLNYDIHAALIQTYVCYRFDGVTPSWMIVNNYEYTKPEEYPEVFKPFFAIEPVVQNTMRITNMTDLAGENEAVNAPGQRALFWTTTIGIDAGLIKEIVEAAMETTKGIADTEGLIWSVTFQPFTSAFMAANGPEGNILGLEGQENVLLLLVTTIWAHAHDDVLVTSAINSFFDAANSLASAKGKAKPFRYMNYSFKTQDPIASYGEKNVEFLRGVSQRYDVKQAFQRLVLGGSKLGRAVEKLVRDEL